MTVGLILVILSAFFFLVPVCLAYLLATQYVMRFGGLSRFGRILYPILIISILMPILWPYLEKFRAEIKCQETRKLDRLSIVHANSIGVRFEVDKYEGHPYELFSDTLNYEKWIDKNNIKYITNHAGTVTEFVSKKPGEGCDQIEKWQQFGSVLCRRDGVVSNVPVELQILVQASKTGRNKNDRDITVTFTESKTGREVAAFHRFDFYPALGNFLLGSDLPFICNDRKSFAAFFQQVVGN